MESSIKNITHNSNTHSLCPLSDHHAQAGSRTYILYTHAHNPKRQHRIPLTPVEVALSQFDDGPIIDLYTTPVHPLSIGQVQHSNSEWV